MCLFLSVYRLKQCAKECYMEQIELDVTGMTCGGCVSRVKQAMLDVPGV